MQAALIGSVARDTLPDRIATLGYIDLGVIMILAQRARTREASQDALRDQRRSGGARLGALLNRVRLLRATLLEASCLPSCRVALDEFRHRAVDDLLLVLDMLKVCCRQQRPRSRHVVGDS